jgi:ubiquinone/menaquinone biosynthesis C-methylase UbiE
MKTNHIVDHFNERVSSYEKGNWVLDKALLQKHVAPFNNLADKRILDLACGTGILGSIYMAKGAKVTGLDINISMLTRACHRLSCVILGDMLYIPCEDNRFDMVVCRQGIHYTYPEPAIKEMKRVLKPNGLIIISSIVPYGIEDIEWFRQRVYIKKPEQVWIPTVEDITQKLIQQGLRIQQVIFHKTKSLLSISCDRTKYEQSVR